MLIIVIDYNAWDSIRNHTTRPREINGYGNETCDEDQDQVSPHKIFIHHKGKHNLKGDKAGMSLYEVTKVNTAGGRQRETAHRRGYGNSTAPVLTVRCA